MSRKQRTISPWLFIGLPERWTLCSLRGFISIFCLSLSLSLSALSGLWQAGESEMSKSCWNLQWWADRFSCGLKKGKRRGIEARIRKLGKNVSDSVSLIVSVFLLNLWSSPIWLTWTTTVKAKFNSHHYLQWQCANFIIRSTSITYIGNEKSLLVTNYRHRHGILSNVQICLNKV